jgi:excisionase family DNA binding protein
MLSRGGTMSDVAPKLAQRADAMLPSFEQLLDSDEAAALLKIHPKTLQKMARNGEIAGVQIGKLWRFRASVLNGWIEHKIAG